MNEVNGEPHSQLEGNGSNKSSFVAIAVCFAIGLIAILVSLPFVTNECRSDRPVIPGDFASSVCITARETGKVVLWFGVILIVVGVIVLFLRPRK